MQDFNNNSNNEESQYTSYSKSNYSHKTSETNYSNESYVKSRLPFASHVLIPDPKGELSPHAYSVIRREKRIRFFSLILWSLIFVASLLAILGVVLATKVDINLGVGNIDKAKQTVKANPVGWYILFGISGFISFILMVRNIFDVTSWKNTEKEIRNNFSSGDQAASIMFHKTYRNIVMKNVRTLWGLIFFVTFFGIYLLTTFLLYYYFVVQEGNKIEIYWELLNLNISGDLGKALENLYNGKTLLVIILGAILVAAAIGLYVFVWIIDKKRLNDLTRYLGPNAHDIIEKVQHSKEQKNKFWLKAYIISVLAFIFLPIVLVAWALWRGIIRRK
ncbi:hypothetical protein V2E24_01070 [Mycoplasmopsis ciconiae]|uniref:Uncharacterized protein n=1 Tax=Mycoplasmopsis ciconiae TaxID=561067 RepID=A0ABU7MLW5_9BACT|nr:hypothetical protein [Mycoplasmopsis ciconiae]